MHTEISRFFNIFISHNVFLFSNIFIGNDDKTTQIEATKFIYIANFLFKNKIQHYKHKYCKNHNKWNFTEFKRIEKYNCNIVLKVVK